MSTTITNDVTGRRYDSWKEEDVRAFVQDYRSNPSNFQKAWDSEIKVMLDNAVTYGCYND